MNDQDVVPADVLLRGSLCALQQCGLLLLDAVALAEEHRLPTAAGIAMLALEELGRHRILLDLCRKSAEGTVVTRKQVTAACGNHETKQRRGQGSLSFRERKDSPLGKLIHAEMHHRPGSPEYRDAEENLRMSGKKRLRRQPAYRHAKRMRAFYVDLNTDGTWSLPRQLDPNSCANDVADAVGDYNNARERIEFAEDLYSNHALAVAIAALADRPELPLPKWLFLSAKA